MLQQTKGYIMVKEWLARKGFQPFPFREETWQHLLNKESGWVNAPTSCGKTFSVFPGAVINFINKHRDHKKITGT